MMTVAIEKPPDYRLIYTHHLPHVGDNMHWRIRHEQCVKAKRQFGTLMPTLRATTRAHVTMIRVQGPHQRALDSDNLRTCLKGLRDALTLKHCGYIVDDSPTWADFDYREDDTRRLLGPRVEVEIRYEEGG